MHSLVFGHRGWFCRFPVLQWTLISMSLLETNSSASKAQGIAFLQMTLVKKTSQVWWRVLVISAVWRPRWGDYCKFEAKNQTKQQNLQRTVSIGEDQERGEFFNIIVRTSVSTTIYAKCHGISLKIKLKCHMVWQSQYSHISKGMRSCMQRQPRSLFYCSTVHKAKK